MVTPFDPIQSQPSLADHSSIDDGHVSLVLVGGDAESGWCSGALDLLVTLRIGAKVQECRG